MAYPISISILGGTTIYLCEHSNSLCKINNWLAIDCGCVYGGKLAAYCIETGEVEYVGGATKEY